MAVVVVALLDTPPIKAILVVQVAVRLEGKAAKMELAVVVAAVLAAGTAPMEPAVAVVVLGCLVQVLMGRAAQPLAVGAVAVVVDRMAPTAEHQARAMVAHMVAAVAVAEKMVMELLAEQVALARFGSSGLVIQVLPAPSRQQIQVICDGTVYSNP
jgi:hypothetical protein